MGDEQGAAPNIWCLDLVNSLVVAGCSDGCIEFWDSFDNSLKNRYRNPQGNGIASVKCVGNR